MLNVFVVAGALFLIGRVAVYAWLTRKEKPAVAGNARTERPGSKGQSRAEYSGVEGR